MKGKDERGEQNEGTGKTKAASLAKKTSLGGSGLVYDMLWVGAGFNGP